jgi:glycosyltransferase involved in cell wall biosynthesis
LRAFAIGIGGGSLPRGVRLHLVGPDWGDRGKLVQLARNLKINDNVEFLDPVEAANRWAVIGSAGMVVLPSRHDSGPLVALEAMAAGKPVIVSDNMGIAPIVRQAGCGFVVEPSSESICSALNRALEQRHRWSEMGDMGREFAFANLTWDKLAKQISGNYEKFLNLQASSVPALVKVPHTF